jgi:hypothetical protein
MPTTDDMDLTDETAAAQPRSIVQRIRVISEIRGVRQAAQLSRNRGLANYFGTPTRFPRSPAGGEF